MGRHMPHSVMRGGTPSHKLLHHGVNCALSTNNVLNPFTPFGDCSLIRQANAYANICQVGSKHDTRECLHMVTTRSAKLMNLTDYGLRVGGPADSWCSMRLVRNRPSPRWPRFSTHSRKVFAP